MADEATRDAVHGGRLADLKACLEDEEFYVDVNQPDEHLWTYLMYAVRFAFNPIVEYLLSQGADIHAVKGDGNNALMIAAREGLVDTMKILLAHGAIPVTRNKSGVQAFTIARQQGHTECEEILVEAMAKYKESERQKREAAVKAREAAEAAEAAAEAARKIEEEAQQKQGKRRGQRER